MNRPHAAEAYFGVKAATRRLVTALGGIDAMAACTRATRTLASEYQSAHSERWIPADVILDGEMIAGEPLVTAALARAAGCALVPVALRGRGDLAVKLAEIGRDVATMFATSATVLAHGRPTAVVRSALIAELDEVARVALEARALLQAGEQIDAG